MTSRVGIGYDVHRRTARRPLVLGGETFPEESGLEGHSDADVLLHAIGDALLGALGLGDLGAHFPPGDPRWEDAPSLELLRAIRTQLEGRGARVVNVDATVVAESPRLGPRRGAMCRNIAAALSIDPARVSVKATTSESLGAIGRNEGIAAWAIAMVESE